MLEPAAYRSRVPVLQGRVNFGGALSGRDITAVNKTVSGLLKLLYPDPEMPVPDEELEEMVRVALEVRRRVKGAAEAGLQERIPEYAFQLRDGRRRDRESSSPRRSCTAMRRLNSIRYRPDRCGESVPAGPETGPSLYRL